MNIAKLPTEILFEILSQMDNCRDILTFCITNSKNKEMCQKNVIYIIKKTIEKKYPNFQIKKFISQIEEDAKKVLLDSQPFSYSKGSGVYQEEFNQMPSKFISKYNRYNWSDIKDAFIYISKCLETNVEINFLEILPLLDTMWGFGLTEMHTTGEHTYIIDILSNQKFKKLKGYNFDKFIDAFIRYNKHRWMPENNYSQFNQSQLTFSDFVYFTKEKEQQYLLTILCKIFKTNPDSKSFYPQFIDLNLVKRNERDSQSERSETESLDSRSEDERSDTESLDSRSRSSSSSSN